MESIERAFENTENAAEAVRKAAADVLSQARALAKAAQTGHISGIKRSQKRLGETLTALQDEVANASSSWRFTEQQETEFLHNRYTRELRSVAAEKGLKMHDRDGHLICYPSILRILPTEGAVRIDRKKTSTIRPSYLADILVRNQKKSSGFSSARFLESLYGVYKDIVADSPAGLKLSDRGRVVPLARIYKLMTALPGAARDYDRSDFARDLYVLDSQGPRRTRDAATVSFPSSTGTKGRSSDLFSFIGPDGDSAEYYGIRFSMSGE